MPNTHDDQLLERIQAKHREVSSYLDNLQTLGTRLTYTNIICGGAAAVLSASLTKTLAEAGVTAGGWKTAWVPLAATICSFVGTTAASIHKARVESCLKDLQGSASRLEGIEIMLEGGYIAAEHAAKDYNECLAKCPTIPARRAPADPQKDLITEPVNKQVVGKTFQARGKVDGIEKGTYLWLAIEVNKKIWPKEGRIFVDNQHHWCQPVYEDGTSETFDLSLWAVDKAADQVFADWLSKAQQTGDFPELKPPPGARRLARVDDLRRASN